jgi:cell wall-associated NlpC family hydrolase
LSEISLKLRLVLAAAVALTATISGRLMALTPAQLEVPSTLSTDRILVLPSILWDSERPRPAPNKSEEVREALLRAAEKYGAKTYVPYVWGGNAIGSESTCNACRACIGSKRHLRVQRRQAACSACRQCGVDCSHFVHRLYEEVGLPLPYLATSKLKHLKGAALRADNLVDVGHDLAQARPGDLVVTARHVVLLLALHDHGFADFIHVSRRVDGGRGGGKARIGGIELARDRDLLHYRGKIVRILRHVMLDVPALDAKPMALPVPVLPLQAPWAPARMAAR